MESFIAYLDRLGGLFADKSTFTIVLIVMAPTLLVSLFLVPLFLWRNFRRGTGRALLGVLVSVGSSALAALLAKLISLPVTALFDRKTGEYIEEAFARFSVKIDLPTVGHAHLSSFASALISAGVSAVLYLVFFVLFLVLFRRLLRRRREGKSPKLLSRAFASVIGVFDALLVSLLLFAPLYTYAGAAMETFHGAAEGIASVYAVTVGAGREEAFQNAKERLDRAYVPVTQSPTVYLCSRAPFHFGRTLFGLYLHDGAFFNVFDEIDDSVEKLTGEMKELRFDPSAYTKEQITVLKDKIGFDEKKEYMSGLVDEVLSYLERYMPEKDEKETENENS